MNEKDEEKIIPNTSNSTNSSLNLDKGTKQKEEKECKLVVSEFYTKLKDETKDIISRQIKICLLLSFFTCFEFLGGMYSGSNAVLTISCHLLSDLLKDFISMISLIILEKPADKIMSYGYHRSEIIGSLSSFLIIWVLVICLLFHSIKEIRIPYLIDGSSMILFSLCGLVITIFMRYIQYFNPIPDSDDGKFLNNFKKDKELKTPLLEDYLGLEVKQENISEKIYKKRKKIMEERYNVHLKCDLIQSIFVIIISIIIYFFHVKHPWVIIFDAFGVWSYAVIILIITIPIAKDCIFILMEAAPNDLDINALYNELLDVTGVINVHDLHIWCVSFDRFSISLHILSEYPQKSLEGATGVCKKFGINHCTIQVENNSEGRRLSFMKCKHESENGVH